MLIFLVVVLLFTYCLFIGSSSEVCATKEFSWALMFQIVSPAVISPWSVSYPKIWLGQFLMMIVCSVWKKSKQLDFQSEFKHCF